MIDSKWGFPEFPIYPVKFVAVLLVFEFFGLKFEIFVLLPIKLLLLTNKGSTGKTGVR